MKLLTLLLVALVVATASGVACPLGVIGDFFDAVAGVDKSFHKKLPCDAAQWNKAILSILGLAATVSVTIAIDVSYWKFRWLSKTDKWKTDKQIGVIKGCFEAWRNGGKNLIKWVVESKKPYWRDGSIRKPTKRQVTSDKKVYEYLEGVGANVVRADEALDRDYQLPAEAVMGALAARAADAKTGAMAVFTGDFDSIFSRCWICPSVPKSGHSRLDMTTHTTIWDRDKFLSIAKIDLRMLAMLFALAFTAMLCEFRKVIQQPTLAGGTIMKMWADAFGDVARALSVSFDQIVGDFLAKVALGRQNAATAHHFSVASPSRIVSAQLIVLNNTVDAAVALSQPRYNELKRRDKHYKESAELQK